MTTFFASLKHSFTEVHLTEQGHIPTETFLDASESLTHLFDLLGSKAFSPVKSDMSGNVNKLRERFVTDKEQFKTLQAMIEAERAQGKNHVTEALLWLKRGLHFTSLALRYNQSDANESLSSSFTRAYEETLKKHHNFAIRPLFSLAMKAAPARPEFYEKLGGTPDDLSSWLTALESVVSKLNQFYSSSGLEK